MDNEILITSMESLDDHLRVEEHITIKDMQTTQNEGQIPNDTCHQSFLVATYAPTKHNESEIDENVGNEFGSREDIYNRQE